MSDSDYIVMIVLYCFQIEHELFTSGFLLKEKVRSPYPTYSILVQNNYIDGRLSTTSFSASVDGISYEMLLAKVGIEAGRHSLVSEPSSEQYKRLQQGSYPRSFLGTLS